VVVHPEHNANAALRAILPRLRELCACQKVITPASARAAPCTSASSHPAHGRAWGRCSCHRHEGSERRASARAQALTGVEVWRMVWGLPLQPQQSKSRDIARAEFERRQRRQPQTRPVFSTRLTGTARTVGALAQPFLSERF
jgi:hypothetical protein